MLKREHESIVSIDSMTHTELACLGLTTNSCSYKYQFVRQSCLTGPNGMKLLVLREANA